MGSEPVHFGQESGAARLERAKAWIATGSEIGPPATGLIGFDVARTTICQFTERDRFALEATRIAGRVDDQLHHDSSRRGGLRSEQLKRVLHRFGESQSRTRQLNLDRIAHQSLDRHQMGHEVS